MCRPTINQSISAYFAGDVGCFCCFFWSVGSTPPSFFGCWFDMGFATYPAREDVQRRMRVNWPSCKKSQIWDSLLHSATRWSPMITSIWVLNQKKGGKLFPPKWDGLYISWKTPIFSWMIWGLKNSYFWFNTHVTFGYFDFETWPDF